MGAGGECSVGREKGALSVHQFIYCNDSTELGLRDEAAFCWPEVRPALLPPVVVVGL